MSWIKMRDELQTHPKVVRILSATKSDKFRVVGGLHAVWCVFDHHSEDGVLVGYTPDLLDQMVGWPGLSAAMLGVGWLVFDGEQTLSLPEFEEHNGQSAKRRADDSKRKKRTRSSGQVSEKCPQSDRTNVRSEWGTEKEKEKDKSKPKDIRAPRFDAQAHLEKMNVHPDVARDWLTLRKGKRLAPTPTALEGVFSEAKKAGVTMDKALRECCQRGWGGFKAEWMQGQASGQKSFHDERAATIAGLTDGGNWNGRFDDGRTIDV